MLDALAETAKHITGGTVGDWLVVGWFTPDYRPLAEALAANLDQRGIPFHLLARPKLAKSWNTLQKPSVVLDAMGAHPGKTIVLMDVDCIARGDISPVAAIAGDVGLILKARQTRKGKAWQKRIAVVLSSRVVVFRPTDGARAFAEEWAALCKTAHYSGDETAMTWAYLRRPDIAYAYLGDLYKGWETNSRSIPENAVIVHESAHAKVRSLESISALLKLGFKAIERRYFRTGRTKREVQERLG